MEETAGTRDEAPYRGLPGAFVYGFRASGSLLFRTYVVVAAVLALAVALLVGLGVVQLMAATLGGVSGVLNLSRGFYVVVGLLVLAPALAPVLLVARRHRRRPGADGRYDRRLAAGGYLFVLSLYVGLVATVPPAQQEPVSGALAPVAAALYALPPAAGAVAPLVAAGVVALLHRWSA